MADKLQINAICKALQEKKGIKWLKEPLEYLNNDGSLDVYRTTESIYSDKSRWDKKKIQYFYDKLFEFYGKKEE